MKNQEKLFNYLSQDSFLILNKKFLQLFGPEITVVLSNFIDKFKYFSDREMDQDGWFFLTEIQQELQMGLSLHKLRKIRKQLIELNFISINRIGVPAKIHYKINAERIIQVLEMDMNLSDLKNLKDKTLKTFMARPLKLVGQDVENLKDSYIYNKDNKKIKPKKDSDTSEKEIKDPPHKKLPPKEFILFAKKFYRDQKKNNKNKKITIEQIHAGAVTLEQLSRINKFDLDTEIIPAIEWATEDDFWHKQIISLASLRTKSRNGSLKFENLFIQFSSKTRSKTKVGGAEVIPGKYANLPHTEV